MDEEGFKKLPMEAASKALLQGSQNERSDFEKAQILHAARSLLGCYRTGDANDPEVYIAAIERIFSNYPLDVIYAVSDPLSGLPGKSKWLPTISEVKEACDNQHRQLRWIDEREGEIAAQLAERERIAEFHLLNPPKETWEETKADLKRRGFGCGEKPRRDITADEIMAKYGVSRVDWDAIPNHPVDFELTATEKAKASERR